MGLPSVGLAYPVSRASSLTCLLGAGRLEGYQLPKEAPTASFAKPMIVPRCPEMHLPG